MKNIKCEEEAPKISVIDSDQILFLNIDKKSEKKKPQWSWPSTAST